MESLKDLQLYSSTKSWNNPGDHSLPLNCVNVLKIYTNVESSIKAQQKPTSICLIIYKHSTHTNAPPRSLLLCRSEEKEQQEQKVELICSVE